MSEDPSFKKNIKKEKESGFAPDFCGLLGKEMLSEDEIDTMKNSSGLTSLNFCVDECNRILNRGHVRDGLSSHRPFVEINARNIKSESPGKGLSESTEIQRCLSGLCVPLSLCGEIQKRRYLNER